jgi:hypothetical protein
VITLVPFFAALALLAVGLAPFVGPFALIVLLIALGLWGAWKAAANLLAVRGENVFRFAETSELLGRGGQDDPDFVLVRRRPQSGRGRRDDSRRMPPTQASARAAARRGVPSSLKPSKEE